MAQTIILVSVVALAGIASYKALGSATSEGTDCAGKSIEALAAVTCKDGESLPASVEEPPPPPEAPAADQGDDDNGTAANDRDEFDPLEELKKLALDILGVTDAVKCFTEGDILACAMTVVSFSPWKLIGVAVKLAKNAKRIKNLIDRLAAARRARKAQDEARDAERVADKGEDAGESCKPGTPGCPCFVAGTPVHTENGWVPIEQLRVGDLVLSRDDMTGEEALRPIEQVFVTQDSPVLTLALEDSMGAIETIEATPPHPFYVEDRGWVAAEDLRPDDLVVSSGGGHLRVAGTTGLLRSTTVYNFEVADFHTYFVGENAAWVHNQYKKKKRNSRREPEEIASGKGPKKISEGKLDELERGCGGPRELWKKMKRIDEDGQEIHYYQHPDHGIVGEKRAGEVDPPLSC